MNDEITGMIDTIHDYQKQLHDIERRIADVKIGILDVMDTSKRQSFSCGDYQVYVHSAVRHDYFDRRRVNDLIHVLSVESPPIAGQLESCRVSVLRPRNVTIGKADR